MTRTLSPLIAATALAVMTLSSSPADASTGTGNFGEHVRECAQTMGFSATHNPGMHQGFSGWDGMPC